MPDAERPPDYIPHREEQPHIDLERSWLAKMTNVMAKVNIWLSFLSRPYVPNVQCDGSAKDLISFFCKLFYCIQISNGYPTNTSLTVAILLNTGASPSLINLDLLLSTWKDSVKSIKALQLQAASSKIVNQEVVVLVLICVGDLQVPTWFGIVKNFVVNVFLRTSFFNKCVREILPLQKKSSLGIECQVPLLWEAWHVIWQTPLNQYWIWS